LRERFTTGYFDEVAVEVTHLRDDIVEGKVFAAGERVLAVAPDAPHRAPRQPHKRAGSTGVS
jgi:hypothetical protein